MTHETPMLASDMKEVVDRCRRMETRLTRFLESQGFDTQVKRATWRGDGTIIVPSPSVALKEVLATIPSTWSRDVAIDIEHKGEILAWVFVP
jgi:hypothetical protein